MAHRPTKPTRPTSGAALTEAADLILRVLRAHEGIGEPAGDTLDLDLARRLSANDFAEGARFLRRLGVLVPVPGSERNARAGRTRPRRGGKGRSRRPVSRRKERTVKLNSLQDVFVDELRDLYHAEKQLIKALPRMAKAANSPELQSALEEHLDVTERQARRLEQIFKELGMAARGKPCHGMQGIIEEGKELLEARSESSPEAIDAAMVAAAQKVEHYEISGYGAARSHAETLGLSRIAGLLQETLDEESEANEKLNQLAESSINAAAAAVQDGEE